MNLLTLADVLLYGAMALLFINIVAKYIQVSRYRKMSEDGTLTAEQKKQMARWSLPVTILAALMGIAGLVIDIVVLTR